MRAGSLFSGAGLCDLGFHRAGFRHAFFCEADPFCRAILARHWPGVPIYNDVRTLDPAALPAVDVLVGGFPCQDVSCGGKRAGIQKDTRSGLWHEYARLIGEIRPSYAVIENVVGRLSLGTGMMRNGLCSPPPTSAPRISAKGYSFLPTPTVTGLCESLAFYLRSSETWERVTNLAAALLGMEYALTGRAARPSGRHMVDVCFVEWMMGVPRNWTAPEGESLAGRPAC
jgi:hypothetical protein